MRVALGWRQQGGNCSNIVHSLVLRVCLLPRQFESSAPERSYWPKGEAFGSAALPSALQHALDCSSRPTSTVSLSLQGPYTAGVTVRFGRTPPEVHAAPQREGPLLREEETRNRA